MTSTLTRLMQDNPAMMHVVLTSLPEPTFLISKQGIYIEAWGGTDHKRHHDPSTLVGLSQYEVLPADKAVWFSQIIVDVIESNKPQELSYELDPKELHCFDGHEGPETTQYFDALVIPLPDVDMVLWIVRNVTEHQAALKQLGQQAKELTIKTYTDHLTQVNNRFALDSLLPHALEIAKIQQESACVFMIDIDCFKELNDQYGHLKGDDALREVAATIKAWAGKNSLCFRYGGDEFLAFIPSISLSGCNSKAEALLQLITNLAIPNTRSRISDTLSVTLGIQHCEHIPDNMTVERFVSIADQALFFAKRRKRGTYHLLEKKETQ